MSRCREADPEWRKLVVFPLPLWPPGEGLAPVRGRSCVQSVSRGSRSSSSCELIRSEKRAAYTRRGSSPA